MKDYLKQRWCDLCHRMDATDTDLMHNLFDDIWNYYNQSHRAYHNQTHLVDVLGKLDWAKQNGLKLSPVQYDEIEMALWFHDIIYDPTRSDNELKSAQMFEYYATQFGLKGQSIEIVYNLILLTKTHNDAQTLQEQIMMDCDLSILGAPHTEFEQYDQNIRKEYHFVPEDDYQAARQKILSDFAQAKRLFKTDLFHNKYDAQARKNLTPK